MNRQPVIFLLGSICLHLVLFFSTRQTTPFEQGIVVGAINARHNNSQLEVYFISKNSISSAKNDLVTTHFPEAIPSYVAQTSLGPVIPSTEFIPTGRLTRLPAPIGEINLDMPSNVSSAINAKIDLTVQIDVFGSVVDVIIPTQLDDKTTAFAQNIAKRFKYAHFSPGEINGNPVPSLLIITVVSEPIQ